MRFKIGVGLDVLLLALSCGEINVKNEGCHVGAEDTFQLIFNKEAEALSCIAFIQK